MILHIDQQAFDGYADDKDKDGRLNPEFCVNAKQRINENKDCL